MSFYFAPVIFATPQYDQLVALRDHVLRKPLGLVFTVDQLSEEYFLNHFGCWQESTGDLVGTLLMTHIDNKTTKMRQVAVAPCFRGRGIGSYMVSKVEYWCRSHNYKMITLAARNTAVPFYQRLNYEIKGEPFNEVGIPHRTMVKKL